MKMQTQACFTAIALAAVMLAAVVLTAEAPRLARADAQQQQSFAIWRAMGDCARLAAKQFPDHTPEGNASARPRARNALRQRHLPVTAKGCPRPARDNNLPIGCFVRHRAGSARRLCYALLFSLEQNPVRYDYLIIVIAGLVPVLHGPAEQVRG